MNIGETAGVLLRDRYTSYLESIADSALNGKFENYLNQLPVLSFNGARYMF